MQEQENEDWLKAALSAMAALPVATIQDVERAADEFVELLRRRAEERLAMRQSKLADHQVGIARAAAQVRETGAYAVIHGGELFDVTDVGGQSATLVLRSDAALRTIMTVSVLALVDADHLAEEEGLRAAPEAARRAVVAELKIAHFFGVQPNDVTLVWDGAPDAEAILDIQILGCRPLRPAWEALLDKGLPMYEYEVAADSWAEEPAGPHAALQRPRRGFYEIRSAGAWRRIEVVDSAAGSVRYVNADGERCMCSFEQWAERVAAREIRAVDGHGPC